MSKTTEVMKGLFDLMIREMLTRAAAGLFFDILRWMTYFESFEDGTDLDDADLSEYDYDADFKEIVNMLRDVWDLACERNERHKATEYSEYSYLDLASMEERQAMFNKEFFILLKNGIVFALRNGYLPDDENPLPDEGCAYRRIIAGIVGRAAVRRLLQASPKPSIGELGIR